MIDSGGGQDLRQFGAGRGGFYTTERSCPGRICGAFGLVRRDLTRQGPLGVF